MYFKPPTPSDNPSNPFFHPLNQKLNEQKSTKARVMFKGSPSDARRDMRVAKETGLYDRATEKPSGRGRVFEITFKSEGQFRRFMSQFEVDLMEYPIKEGVEIDEATVDTSHYRSDHGRSPKQDETGGWSFSDKKFGKEFYMSPNKMPYKDAKVEAQKIAKKKGFSKIYLAASYHPEFTDGNVQLDEVTGETTVMAKSDRNQYERITRALTAANRTGKIKGYEGAHFNERTGMLTLIFDSKAHKPASERRKVAKMIKDFGLEFSHSVEEGFASDAQRRAAFASGYKAKGKKKKEEEVEEGLRQAMSGPKETPAQKRKRQEKDNFDLYKKRQKRIAALRGDPSSRKLTPKQQRDYLKRVNLDQIKAMEETIMEGAKFSTAQLNMLKKEYGKIGKVDPSKPTYKKLTDMLDRMSDEQLMQIHKADIKFMSSLAANRLQSRGKLKESIDEEKGTYSSMGRRGIDKPLMAYIADLDKELKKMGMQYSDKKVNPDDVMKAYNANMSPKETAAMLKKKAK